MLDFSSGRNFIKTIKFNPLILQMKHLRYQYLHSKCLREVLNSGLTGSQDPWLYPQHHQRDVTYLGSSKVVSDIGFEHLKSSWLQIQQCHVYYNKLPSSDIGFHFAMKKLRIRVWYLYSYKTRGQWNPGSNPSLRTSSLLIPVVIFGVTMLLCL